MAGEKKRCRGPHAPRDTFMSIMRRERGSRSERVICSDGGFGDRERERELFLICVPPFPFTVSFRGSRPKSERERGPQCSEVKSSTIDSTQMQLKVNFSN